MDAAAPVAEGEADGETATTVALVMAAVALVLPAAVGVVAHKFALIFADLGIRLPLATEAFLPVRTHLVVGVVLLVLAVTARVARSAWPFGLAVVLYLAGGAAVLLLPLLVIVETLGTAP